jgi:hypothetical protein
MYRQTYSRSRLPYGAKNEEEEMQCTLHSCGAVKRRSPAMQKKRFRTQVYKGKLIDSTLGAWRKRSAEEYGGMCRVDANITTFLACGDDGERPTRTGTPTPTPTWIVENELSVPGIVRLFMQITSFGLQ